MDAEESAGKAPMEMEGCGDVLAEGGEAEAGMEEGKDISSKCTLIRRCADKVSLVP
jgi:hypothetical protein